MEREKEKGEIMGSPLKFLKQFSKKIFILGTNTHLLSWKLLRDMGI